jgi:hypothetical protein
MKQIAPLVRMAVGATSTIPEDDDQKFFVENEVVVTKDGQCFGGIVTKILDNNKLEVILNSLI